jgi:hypothetical protein
LRVTGDPYLGLPLLRSSPSSTDVENVDKNVRNLKKYNVICITKVPINAAGETAVLAASPIGAGNRGI